MIHKLHPKRAIAYRPWVLRKLAKPAAAESYLNAALADSEEAFLVALRNVAEAFRIARVAELAGVSRESLYRALSDRGNPRLSTLRAVLQAVGLRIAVTQERRKR